MSRGKLLRNLHRMLNLAEKAKSECEEMETEKTDIQIPTATLNRISEDVEQALYMVEPELKPTGDEDISPHLVELYAEQATPALETLAERVVEKADANILVLQRRPLVENSMVVLTVYTTSNEMALIAEDILDIEQVRVRNRICDFKASYTDGREGNIDPCETKWTEEIVLYSEYDKGMLKEVTLPDGFKSLRRAL